MSKQAMTLALEALAYERSLYLEAGSDADGLTLSAVAALKEAIKQHDAEPVAWQPIDTAPKDRSILIFDGEEVMEAYWFSSWYGDKKRPGWMPANLDEEYGRYVDATHWMPLPATTQPTKGE